MSATETVRHPDEATLALFAGRDLPWLPRMRVSHHVSRCGRCSGAVQRFRSARKSLATAVKTLPEGLDWEKLAAEMTANIHVGLAAGQCVATSPKRVLAPKLGWKPAAAFASIAVLVAGGWWLNVPPSETERLGTVVRQIWNREMRAPAVADFAVSVGAVTDGIEVKQNGAVMTLVNPGASPTVVTASTGGAMRARYVDADTGQVTITNVYAQ